MKKILILIVTLLLLFAFVACTGGEPEATPEVETTPETNTEIVAGTYFSVDSFDIVPGMRITDVQTEIGAEKSYFEAPSCAFNGMDKIYTYPGFDLYTFSVDGVDRIHSIVLTDDTVSTPEGISVGAAKADVLAAYSGEPEDTGTALTYSLGATQLKFVMDGEKVASIEYLLVVPT